VFSFVFQNNAENAEKTRAVRKQGFRSAFDVLETRCNATGFQILVEMGGVEPPSESTLTRTSPGADGYSGLSPFSLTLAQTVTRLRFGSFIMHGAGKTYRTHVLH